MNKRILMLASLGAVLVTGIVATSPIPIDADRKCRVSNDGGLDCQGGRSETEGLGGFGGRDEIDSDGYITQGGHGGPGGGGGFRCQSDGSGGNDCVGEGFNSGQNP
jgi:hypothetical protein